MKSLLPLAILLMAVGTLILPAAAAVPENPYRGSPSSPLDIDVTHISESPRYAFDAARNAPSEGDQVTFTAWVKNRGGSSGTGVFTYLWYVDGQNVSSGTAQTIDRDKDLKINYTWTWQAGDHDISFFADPVNAISEKSEQNNLRTVRTTGLRVGFWVEQSVYRYFNDNQYAFTQQYGIGDEANSWEDWAQRQMALANRLQAGAVYLSSPSGILDRWRLDQVMVVPDDTLPLNGGSATGQPDTRDRTVDMMWGVEEDILTTGYYRTTDNSANAFNQELSLIHEILHARYLEDASLLNVAGHSIGVLDDQGARIFPGGGEVVHANSDVPSLMNGDSSPSEWEAAVLNLWARKRPQAGWGNYDGHPGTGWFLANYSPASNYLRVVDSDGKPVDGALVQVYRAGEVPMGSTDRNLIEAAKEIHPRYIDNVADAEGTTDAQGLYSLGANPFSVQGPTGDGDLARCVDLVRVRYGGNVTLLWLDLPMVQTRYFRGNTTRALYDVRLPVRLAPVQKVTFSGKVSDGATGAGLSQIPVTFSREDGGYSFSVMTGPFGIFYHAQLDQSTNPARSYLITANADSGDSAFPRNPAYGTAELRGIRPDQNRADLDLVLSPPVTSLPTAIPGSGTLVETAGSPIGSANLGSSGSHLQQAQSLKAAGTGLSEVTVALARTGTPTRSIQVHVRSTLGGADLAKGIITPSMVTS
ncbi:MAG: hypothetical protein LUO91_06180, partial [Methanomicrobiales archaeon]|nr:hypothetical protein [Methanomicrobiales archaeon]